MLLDPVEVLGELIAIPSVNPRYNETPGGEARLTEFLENLLAQLGLTVWRQPVLPGRENVLGRLDGDVSAAHGGPVVMLDAHQDTVPVEGMTVEPFRSELSDGRVYGRGACDVKGGMAAILAAVARLAHERRRPMPTVLVSFTVDEENGFAGARRLAESWSREGDELAVLRPGAAVVLEPTGLDLVVAHKGVIRWTATAKGKAAHSSQPETGENAIYKMARAVTAIQQHAAALVEGKRHALCGVATASVGTIHGGVGVNTVPDRCTIEIECRPFPGDNLEAARERIVELGGDIEHEPPYLLGPALSDEGNGPLAQQLSAVVHRVAGRCEQRGVPWGTNAPLFAAAGVPTLVFGPGSVAQAHTADEWIDIEQLRQAAEILYQFCSQAATA